MSHADEHRIETVLSKSIASCPDNDMVRCACGEWDGLRHAHKTHVADSRPRSSLPADTIDALSGCQYSAAGFLRVLDEVQASAAPLNLPQRLTERLDEMRADRDRFFRVRDGGPSESPAPTPLPLIHDLTCRSIAHHIEAERPKTDEEALAFARRMAAAFGYDSDGRDLVARASVQAWHELYGEHPLFEPTGLSHAEFAKAARVMLMRNSATGLGLAQLYMLMALYEALTAGEGGR